MDNVLQCIMGARDVATKHRADGLQPNVARWMQGPGRHEKYCNETSGADRLHCNGRLQYHVEGIYIVAISVAIHAEGMYTLLQ